MPSVSIGMPVFNDRRFLSIALDSILSQTYEDFELIISDDTSTDGSEEICRQYAAKDCRIRYFRQSSNLGISANMIFLLNQATGKYFMWAANDDLWDRDFIQLLVQAHQNNSDAVVAFCPVVFIDEDGNMISEYGIRRTDYAGATPKKRINKLVRKFDDSFGYGLFKRDKILGVQFPTWWWINSKCAYNNIYPTLCYYLSRGNFSFVPDRPLWFNRLKKEENVNHKVPFNLTFIRGWLAFTLRRFNLVYISLVQIVRASGRPALAIAVAPLMFYRWFLCSSYQEFRSRLALFRRQKIRFY
jgi:glycosyltransferase involved in cell wall biosynthesis